MKKLLLYTFLLIAPTSMHAVLVQFPTAQILTQRLIRSDFDHFVKNTKLIKELAEQKKEALDVHAAVEQALLAYSQLIKNDMITFLIKQRKAALITCLLQHCPEAIKELQNRKILQ